VLVAFDGPVAELPSTRELADRLRVLVSEGSCPAGWNAPVAPWPCSRTR
jgi:hypothetical protein